MGMSSLLPDPGGLGAFTSEIWRGRATAPPSEGREGKFGTWEGRAPWRAAARGPQLAPEAQQVERTWFRAGFRGNGSPRPTKGAPLPALPLKSMFYACELSSSA